MQRLLRDRQDQIDAFPAHDPAQRIEIGGAIRVGRGSPIAIRPRPATGGKDASGTGPPPARGNPTARQARASASALGRRPSVSNTVFTGPYPLSLMIILS